VPETPVDPLEKVWNPDDRIGDMLRGKRGLVVGIANEQSIAFGCAAKLRAFGAELAVTWLNEKAERFVRPLAERLQASIMMPLDVERPDEVDAVFARIADEWGRLDFVIHSLAFAPRDDLHGRVVDCSAEGFTQAMRVSAWSFLRMAKLAEPLMTKGGVLVTMSYYGADKVVDNYNMMGPVKAALESTVRYAAAELGEQGIRVHALSPGPLKTRAASGIDQFDELLASAEDRAPTRKLATIEDVGAMAAFLASSEARNLTGGVHDIDGGFSITA
jgi:enoyl-[acyl-carrier protein] reductase I